MSGIGAKLARMGPEKRAYLLGELIGHLTTRRSDRWSDAVRLLTDVAFVEAKARQGLAYGLLEDYASTKKACPDYEDDQVQAREMTNAYVKQLIASSRSPSDQQYPEPPSTELVRSTEGYHRNSSQQSMEDLRAWEGFVSSHTAALDSGIAPVFQMAWNSADGGPVADSVATEVKSQSDAGRVWLRSISRPTFMRRPVLLRILEGPDVMTHAVALTADGTIALSAGSDGVICVWDLGRGLLTDRLEGHTGSIRALAVAPDGQTAVSGGQDGNLRVWDLVNGRCVMTLDGQDGEITRIAITPDASLAAFVGKSRAIRLCDLKRVEAVREIIGEPASALAMTANGRTIVAGAAVGGAVWCIDACSGETVWANKRHESSVSSVAVTPDGRRAVTGAFDQTVAVWDVQQGRCLALLGGHSTWVLSVAITPDGRIALSTGGDGDIAVWDIDGKRCMKVLRGHTTMVDAVAVSADGRIAVSGGDLGHVRVWDLTGDCSEPRSKTKTSVVASAPTLQRMVLSQDKGSVSVWQPDDNEALQFLMSGDTRLEDFCDISVSRNLECAVSGHADGIIRLWDLATCQVVNQWQGHEGTVSSVQITPDMSRVTSIGTDRQLRLWDPASAECLQRLSGDAELRLLAQSPDGRTAFFAEKDNVLQVMDLTTWQIVHRLVGHSRYLHSVVVSPTGRFLISQAFDQTLRMWDLATGECVWAVDNRSDLGAILITHEEQYVIAVDEFAIRMINFSSGRIEAVLGTHDHEILSILLSPDGRHLVSGSKDNTLRVWHLADAKCIATHVSDIGALRAKMIDLPTIVADSGQGKPVFLQLENVPLAGAPVVIPTRLWLHGHAGKGGHWDKQLSTECYWCGRRFVVDELMLGRGTDCPNRLCRKPLHVASCVCDGGTAR